MMSHSSKAKRQQYKKSRGDKKRCIGIVDHVSHAHGYVVVEGRDKDIYVKTTNLKGAIHKDTVEVMLSPRKRGDHEEGRVYRVVKRNQNRFAGRITVTPQGGVIRADVKKIRGEFFISKADINGAKTHDIVLFEVTEWGTASHPSKARVVEVLGKRGENEAEMHAIMAEFNLPFNFTEEVLEEAKKIQDSLSEKDIRKRRDFRDIPTFTIDPDDAKDFDDAISLKSLSNGSYEIGVHIADVSHYVRPGSLIDKEAYRRATSTYLVDRTVPMLPERLSNHLCSLRPKEDKLTFSIVMEMDQQGVVHKVWYGKTVICSNRRFTYEEAQDILDGGVETIYANELTILNTIAKNVREKRFETGALNFEIPEIKFELDSNAKPIRAIVKERKDAHKLVEEFMLIANKVVASHIHGLKKKSVSIYRVHDSPDQEKMKDFKAFAKQFGHTMNIGEKAISKSLNAIMEKIAESPEQHILSQLAIRAMAKAHYTTKSTSHFGLAFDHYTHFTSPIRRYPDVLVHRILQAHLEGTSVGSSAEYEALCIHCSEKERQVVSAERASVKYKQVELMSTAEDKVYEGIISGVSDFGLFVEMLETRCEGMIRLKDIDDDFYQLDKKKYRIIGKRKKKVYQFGDLIHVCITKIDLDKRTIDLMLYD